jgi:hypothetical protein
MQSWYARHWSPGTVATANDYTSWDRGCDRVFTQFDAHLLRSAGIPEPYVATYLHRKFNSRSYLGPHMSMQFSGDRWTWLFNTLRCAALTGASLNCPTSTPAMFSGDDSAVLGRHGIVPRFAPRSWLMVPKPEITATPTFCGYQLGGPYLTVSGTVLLQRARIALRNGRRDHGIWDSLDYALQFVAAEGPENVAAATAAQISVDARSLYSLPPSVFPVNLVTGDPHPPGHPFVDYQLDSL